MHVRTYVCVWIFIAVSFFLGWATGGLPYFFSRINTRNFGISTRTCWNKFLKYKKFWSYKYINLNEYSKLLEYIQQFLKYALLRLFTREPRAVHKMPGIWWPSLPVTTLFFGGDLGSRPRDVPMLECKMSELNSLKMKEEEEEEEEEEESLFKADAVNEEDSERDRATQV